MTHERLGIADVKPLLQQRAAELVALLCPGARKEGGVWVAPNPRRGVDSASSFVVWSGLQWKEHDAGDDEKGDAIDLIIYSGQAADRAGALRWAKDFLGLSNATAPEVIRLREASRAADEKARAEAERQADSMRGWAKKVFWIEATDLRPGMPAWIYLEDCRCIPMTRLWAKQPMRALKTAMVNYRWPSREDIKPAWMALRPRDGVSKHPALLAAMTEVNGAAFLARGEARSPSKFCLHRTYVARDGLAKARVPSAKKMAGDQLGCAIKLWRGESGLSDADAVKRGTRGPLGISEGIETGLSVVADVPEMRHWAMGSLANICAMPWPKCASEIVWFADRPKEGEAGEPARRAIEEGSARLAQWGPVRVAYPPDQRDKDFNDALMRAATQRGR